LIKAIALLGLLSEDPCIIRGKVTNVSKESIQIEVDKTTRNIDVRIIDKTVIKTWDGSDTTFKEVIEVWNERKYKLFVYLRYDYDYRVPKPEIITPVEIYFGTLPNE
jgi:hypothetical protein